ncbi:MAG: hypothetical protein GYB68_04665 [Chloroflexi bacterium]|nr:hypothetical protein [Chloroflexota bacterium]
MRTVLEFIAQIRFLFYGLAAIGILSSLRGLIMARQTLRVAMFGLEREEAQRRLRSSLTWIFSLLLLIGVVFTISDILLPNLDFSEEQAEILPTPTSALFIERSPVPTESLLLFPTITPNPAGAISQNDPAEQAGTVDPAAAAIEPCVLGARITEPTSGQTVTGQVQVQGGANVINFASYKFELRGQGTNNEWVVIGDFNQTVLDPGLLGSWDSTSLTPGEYTLRLIVYRLDGSFVTPCDIPIIVE